MQQASAHEPPVVVGVVGFNHAEGILQNWETVHSKDVEKVLAIPTITKIERSNEIFVMFCSPPCLAFGILISYSSKVAYKCLKGLIDWSFSKGSNRLDN